MFGCPFLLVFAGRKPRLIFEDTVKSVQAGKSGLFTDDLKGLVFECVLFYQSLGILNSVPVSVFGKVFGALDTEIIGQVVFWNLQFDR